MRFIILTGLFLFTFSQTTFAGDFKPATHWKSGMIVGGIAGGVTSGAVVGGMILNAASKDDSCGNGAFCGISGAGSVTGWIVGSSLGGAAVGAGIGALIGSAIPKKEKIVSVSPYFSMDGQSGGAMVSGAF